VGPEDEEYHETGSTAGPSYALRDPQVEENESPPSQLCQVCCQHIEGALLLDCKACGCSFHSSCLEPKQHVLPKGHWYCTDCSFGLERSRCSMSGFKHVYPHGQHWRYEISLRSGKKLSKGNFETAFEAAKAAKKAILAQGGETALPGRSGLMQKRAEDYYTHEGQQGFREGEGKAEAPEEYECEKNCGFESTSRALVEAHEKMCRGAETIASGSTRGLQINDAVAVKWNRTRTRCFQAVIEGFTSGGRVRVQFDGTWALATVPPAQVEPLHVVDDEDLPAGYRAGCKVEAQDPFARDGGDAEWHPAEIVSVRHGTKVVDGQESVLPSEHHDNSHEWRFWVRFLIADSAACQWCGVKHIRLPIE